MQKTLKDLMVEYSTLCYSGPTLFAKPNQSTRSYLKMFDEDRDRLKAEERKVLQCVKWLMENFQPNEHINLSSSPTTRDLRIMAEKDLGEESLSDGIMCAAVMLTIIPWRNLHHAPWITTIVGVSLKSYKAVLARQKKEGD